MIKPGKEQKLDKIPTGDKEAKLFVAIGELTFVKILPKMFSELLTNFELQVNHQGHPAIMVRGKPKLIRQVAVEADGHLAKQVKLFFATLPSR